MTSPPTHGDDELLTTRSRVEDHLRERTRINQMVRDRETRDGEEDSVLWDDALTEREIEVLDFWASLDQRFKNLCLRQERPKDPREQALSDNSPEEQGLFTNKRSPAHPGGYTSTPGRRRHPPAELMTDRWSSGAHGSKCSDRANTSLPPLANYGAIENFAGKPSESWESYIELWEVKTLKYGLDNRQRALALPDKLVDFAFRMYSDIVKEQPGLASDYMLLKDELTKVFGKHKSSKQLWSVTQGRKSIGDFYNEIVTSGKSVYADMPDQYRDRVLKDAFLQGLRPNYAKVISRMHPKTLREALDEARKVEEADQEYDTHRVAAAECSDVKPLQAQREALTELVRSQVTTGQRRHSGPQNWGNGNSWTKGPANFQRENGYQRQNQPGYRNRPPAPPRHHESKRYQPNQTHKTSSGTYSHEGQEKRRGPKKPYC